MPDSGISTESKGVAAMPDYINRDERYSAKFGPVTSTGRCDPVTSTNTKGVATMYVVMLYQQGGVILLPQQILKV